MILTKKLPIFNQTLWNFVKMIETWVGNWISAWFDWVKKLWIFLLMAYFWAILLFIIQTLGIFFSNFFESTEINWNVSLKTTILYHFSVKYYIINFESKIFVICRYFKLTIGALESLDVFSVPHSVDTNITILTSRQNVLVIVLQEMKKIVEKKWPQKIMLLKNQGCFCILLSEKFCTDKIKTYMWEKNHTLKVFDLFLTCNCM